QRSARFGALCWQKQLIAHCFTAYPACWRLPVVIEPTNMEAAAQSDSPENPGSSAPGAEGGSAAVPDSPVCLIVLGMAGSGKTTFVQRLTAHLHSQNSAPYVINLDPAVHEVPFPANIDIRDTVNYKEVMKQYSLGPNGGIVTSLNLFATRFDQVTFCRPDPGAGSSSG
ncbi:hypothetical protein ILYODFUR_037541, partial [Ilyodon furcidens]